MRHITVGHTFDLGFDTALGVRSHALSELIFL
jgi:hypothetical protein